MKVSSFQKSVKIDNKSLQIWSRKIKVRKSHKKWIWKGLERLLGGVWGGFWEGFEALEASWAVFCIHFFMLAFGVVSKSASGGFLAGSWIDFWGFGRDFGVVLGGIWEGF